MGQKRQPTLRELIMDLTRNVNGVKGEVKGLKDEIREIKDEIIEMKDEIREIKEDIEAIKNTPTMKKELQRSS